MAELRVEAEVGGVVVGTHQGGQITDEFLGPLPPGLAVHRVGGGSADAGGHWTAALQAGPPDDAIDDLEAGITRSAPVRRKGVAGAHRTREGESALDGHLRETPTGAR